MRALRVGLFLLFVARLSSAVANPGDIYAEVMASPLGGWFSPGHAFICIDYDLNSGIKEECYGFYPKINSNAAVIGAPSLANEFKKTPDRFSKIDWSVKKKITDAQRSAFYNAVLRADRAPYTYTTNNCGDFVSDAIDALGWANVKKSILPNPYVHDLVVANIAKFVIVSIHPQPGTITRRGSSWVQHVPTVTDRIYTDEGRSDDTYLYVRDTVNHVELRLPLKGGDYDYNHSGQGWHKSGTVTADFDS